MNLRDLFENNEPGAMAQAVTRRILSTRGDLLSRYGVKAVTQAIDDVTQGDDWEEIGSSDVSAYVRYVEDYLRDHHGSRGEMADRRPFAETGVAEGSGNNITYKQQRGKNKFSVEMLVDGKSAGIFQYDANSGRTIVELDPEYRGQGPGQRLILKGIYTAAMMGLDYREDESRTPAFDNAMDSLADNGYIVNDDEYWYVTDKGEQFLKQGVAEVSLREFAPDDGGDDGDDGFDEETLRRMAAQWYNGDEDPRIERALAAAGWEIGQDEGYDDEPGVFVVMVGDVNGRSYLSWPADELRQDVSENQRRFINVYDDDLYAVDPKTKEIIAHLGNPYNNRTAVLIKKRQHEQQGHLVMSGMRAKFYRDIDEQGVAEGIYNRNNINDNDLYAVDPKTKEIIAHLGNPYKDHAVAMHKRRHEEQGHEVMSGMKIKYGSGVELDEAMVQENRTIPVVIIGPNNQKVQRQVRIAPGTKNPVQSIMRYYARQGMELYSIAGQKVTAGALAEGPAVDAYMAGKSPAIAHWANQLDHIAGKNESRMTCPECGGPAYQSRFMAEEQDACYHKVRSRYKVWPSAYASGALVQCRKKGAANWGTGGKKK